MIYNQGKDNGTWRGIVNNVFGQAQIELLLDGLETDLLPESITLSGGDCEL